MSFGNLQSWISVSVLGAIFAGGVLMPSTPACACRSDPENQFLHYLYYGVKQTPGHQHNELIHAQTLSPMHVERVHEKYLALQMWHPSLRLGRDNVLGAIPLGTEKEAFVSALSDSNEQIGKIPNTLCEWSQGSRLYRCTVNTGNSWFDAVTTNVLVEFHFGQSPRLEQVRVQQQKTFLGKQSVTEV